MVRLLREQFSDLTIIAGNVTSGEGVDFLADSLSGIDELDVQFTSTPTGSFNSFYWDFGDGSGSNLSNPERTLP